MSLGIVVVYKLGEELRPLLELHLAQIRLLTSTPYTIYAGGCGLAPALAQTLRRTPHLRLEDCPATGLPAGQEHAAFLEQLTRLAIEDGVDHVVTLHLDSFPVRPGWAAALTAPLSAQCPMATPEGVSTACLVFRRDFYEQQRPTYWVTEGQRDTPEFLRFQRVARPVVHSGVGYVYAAYRAGLSWRWLRDTTPAGIEAANGGLCDDLVFHIGGMIRSGEAPAVADGAAKRRAVARVERALALAPSLPRPLYRLARRLFGGAVRRWAGGPRLASNRADAGATYRQLMDDPAAFLRRLRREAEPAPQR